VRSSIKAVLRNPSTLKFFRSVDLGVSWSSAFRVADCWEMSVLVRRIISRNLSVFRIPQRNFGRYLDKSYEWPSSELKIEEASTPPTSWYTDGTELDQLVLINLLCG
jgi:hypothetical protein